MNIIFLGYLVPLEKMNQYSGISVAGNKMQYNIINELNKLPNVTVHSVSVLPHACYPRDKHILVGKKEYEYHGIKCNEVFYWNLPIIKQVTQIVSVYRKAKSLVKSLKKADEDVLVMGFNMFPQVGIPMKKLRKYTETLCVLADLPIDDNTDRKGVSKWLRSIFDWNTKRNLSSCDNFVVLSEYVKEEVLPDKKVLVVEGGISEEDITDINDAHKERKKTVIVFSGALTEYNGIVNLIESMQYLQSDAVELRIYGDGYLKEYVIQNQEKDHRIRYCGRVSNDEMKQCQREADILINPRQVDNQISKYTFPSKMFEYLLSRTIVVSTRIPSYPEEYLDKMILAEDSPVGLAEAIGRVLRMSREERASIEEKACCFIVNEKLWTSQIKKMYGFMESLFNA